jgi:hypothetical protein
MGQADQQTEADRDRPIRILKLTRDRLIRRLELIVDNLISRLKLEPTRAS